MATGYDAVVVGAGPNGLTAAITLAKTGRRVLVIEANATPGGGCRTAELTLPGFHHDICAAVHPVGIASPAFRELSLDRYGLEWVQPPVPLAHPLPDGSVALLHRALDQTAEGLGADGRNWIRLLQPFASKARELMDDILRPARIPQHPLLLTRFGLFGLKSCARVAESNFTTTPAKALFSGCAGHSFLPLDKPGSAAFGLVLALTAHAVGWPCARGGSQRIIDALVRCLQDLGGEVQTNTRVRSLRDLPDARHVLFDLTPRQVIQIAGDALPARYKRRLDKFQYGPGVFKVDWALSAPIPWSNPECLKAGTVHVGGSAEEIATAEAAAWTDVPAEKPFVLAAQPSLFDPSRAPTGKHTAWAYCHVPNGCTVDMTTRIEAQVERFAPGFRDVILARHVMGPVHFESHNANFVGGDISGGANTLQQTLLRPIARWNPYSTPNPRLFLCSSSTPPGGGVHGMCGYWAARSVFRQS